MFFEIYLRHRWIRTIFLLLSFYYILTCVCHELRYWSTSFSTESNSGSWVPSYKHLLDNVLHPTELWKYFWNLSPLTQHSFWVDCESVAGVLASKGTLVLFLGSPMALGNQAFFVTEQSVEKNLNLNLVFATMSMWSSLLEAKTKGRSRTQTLENILKSEKGDHPMQRNQEEEEIQYHTITIKYRKSRIEREWSSTRGLINNVSILDNIYWIYCWNKRIDKMRRKTVY